MIDRISGTTIDETGRQSSDLCVVRIDIDQAGVREAEASIERCRAIMNQVPQSSILAAANAANYYGDDAVRFANECDKATEFLISRVAAAGGDRRRFRDRRSRKRITAEAMAHAGVPENTWKDWLKAILSLGFIALPTGPWALVIKAVLLAVQLYFGGGT